MNHKQPPVGVPMGPRQPQVNYQQATPNQPPVGVPMGPRQPQVNYQRANPNQPPAGVPMGPRQPQVNYQKANPNQPPAGVPMGPRQPQVNYQQANPNQPAGPIPPQQAPQVRYVVQGHPQPQPPYGATVVVQPQDGKWSSGLFDCFQDASNCCITCWCPCITFGQIAEITDRGRPSCLVSGSRYFALAMGSGCHWMYSCTYRTKLKVQYGIPQDQCEDCCVHFCCEICALCQEYRELQHRGFDVVLGWDGNAAKMNVQMRATTPPNVQGRMMR